jgi:tryptophan synthase alpha chain
MNRIQKLFQHKKERICSVYFTAGFPRLTDTVEVLLSLDQCGVDIVEIGIPFSDPLADGPVIQESSRQALDNGMSIALLLEQLTTVRKQTQMPLILMGYINPVLQYGIARFCRDAKACGIDGFIVPDLPVTEYKAIWQPLMAAYDLQMIFLITPQTSLERVHELDELSNAFLYLVTASGTTGETLLFDEQQKAYFSQMKGAGLRNPLLAGFGIRSKADFDQVCQYADGAIIGSRFIEALQESEEGIRDTVKNFVSSLL